MILGLGTDIIEVSRMAQKLTKTGFKEKVFSAAEISFCERQANPRNIMLRDLPPRKHFSKLPVRDCC